MRALLRARNVPKLVATERFLIRYADLVIITQHDATFNAWS